MKVAACALLLIALGGATLAPPSAAREPAVDHELISKPIAISCPSSPDSGIVEIVSFQPEGLLLRTRVFYQAGTATRVQLTQELPGTAFGDPWLDVNMASDTGVDLLSFVMSVADEVTRLKRRACEGTDEDRSKFDDLLKSNKRSLPGSAG